MSRKPVGINAFTPEYLEALKERDETEAGAEPESGTPLVLREKEGKFALFRPWKSFEAGDSPEAEFDTREDALRFLAARGALSRPRPYEIESAEGRMAEGFAPRSTRSWPMTPPHCMKGVRWPFFRP